MTTKISLRDDSSRVEPPTPSSTHSYWHRDPSKTLQGHRTTENLPNSTDVVVIGSGITGTFAARELVGGGRRVLMLDAREACWGATGRNGGHCQPGVWDSPPDVARFELATFELLNELITKNNIPCDWQVVGGIHGIYSEKVLEAAKSQIQALQQHADLQDKATLILDKDELAAKHVPDAIAAIYQPNAAKCWPYKLVAWLLERLLSEHNATEFNLQTNTPVQSLEQHESTWVVHTHRGKVSAREVLLASNAYTPHLLPKMTGLIIPVRGQVCALEPPQGAMQLPHSYVWIKGADHQYLIHRGPGDTEVETSADRSLIFGGERLAVAGGEEGIFRDDEINPTISEALHRGVNAAINLGSGSGLAKQKSPLLALYEWTGIMGYSSDGSPWVGRVPEELATGLGADSNHGARGLWISAGYTGHGMPVAARCGIAVAEMMLGKDVGIQVPDGWIMSKERADSSRGLEIPKTIDELINSLSQA